MAFLKWDVAADAVLSGAEGPHGVYRACLSETWSEAMWRHAKAKMKS